MAKYKGKKFAETVGDLRAGMEEPIFDEDEVQALINSYVLDSVPFLTVPSNNRKRLQQMQNPTVSRITDSAERQARAKERALARNRGEETAEFLAEQAPQAKSRNDYRNIINFKGQMVNADGRERAKRDQRRTGRGARTRRPVAVRAFKQATPDKRQAISLPPTRDKDDVIEGRNGFRPAPLIYGRDVFQTVDAQGRPLSTIEQEDRGRRIGESDKEKDKRVGVRGFGGRTEKDVRRQDQYRDLITSLIRHGIDIHSSERNNKSNPFHQKFINELPSDLNVMNFEGENIKPEIDRLTEEKEKMHRDRTLHYRRNPPQFLEGWGDLAAADFGMLPLIDTRMQNPTPAYLRELQNRGPIQSSVSPTGYRMADRNVERLRRHNNTGLFDDTTGKVFHQTQLNFEDPTGLLLNYGEHNPVGNKLGANHAQTYFLGDYDRNYQ